MKAQDKANQLFNEYLQIVIYGSKAKQCAIIAVKEIQKSIPEHIPSMGYGSAMFVNPDVKYYQEVLTELERM